MKRTENGRKSEFGVKLDFYLKGETMIEETIFWMVIGFGVCFAVSYTYVKTIIKDWFRR